MEKFTLCLLFFQSIILNSKENANNTKHSIRNYKKLTRERLERRENSGRDMGF